MSLISISFCRHFIHDPQRSGHALARHPVRSLGALLLGKANRLQFTLVPKLSRRLVALLLPLLVTACATLPNGTPAQNDPLESYNRTMYSINDQVDRTVIQPVARGYRAITPDFFRTGVTNFFNNISDLATVVNDLFQGKGSQGLADGERFMINTTVGVLGLIDVATPSGLQRHREDFGQTLAVWGWDSSTYLVLPILGPSTVRDTLGMFGDYPESLYANMHTTLTKETEVYAFEALNTRTNLLAASNLLDTAALDPYAFLRDAYLQRRRNQIYDGHPPPSPEDE